MSQQNFCERTYAQHSRDVEKNDLDKIAGALDIAKSSSLESNSPSSLKALVDMVAITIIKKVALKKSTFGSI